MSSDANNHTLQSSAKTILSFEQNESSAVEEGKHTVVTPMLDRIPCVSYNNPYFKKDTVQSSYSIHSNVNGNTAATHSFRNSNSVALNEGPTLDQDIFRKNVVSTSGTSGTIATNNILPTENLPSGKKVGDVPTQLTGRQSTDSGYNNAVRLFNIFSDRFAYSKIGTIKDNKEGNSQFPLILSCFANWLLRQAPANKPEELYMPKSHLQILS